MTGTFLFPKKKSKSVRQLSHSLPLPVVSEGVQLYMALINPAFSRTSTSNYNKM